MQLNIPISCSLFLVLFISSVGSAQKTPSKFGEPEAEELLMKFYPTDSTASAAILCNYGYFRSSDFQFEHFIRTKILKKEGYEWADHTYSAYSDIYVKGYTYNVENGETIKTKLNQSSIITERFKDGRRKVRFAMPNVREGSVIDIEITCKTFPEEWRFQEIIPVKWSEINLEPTQQVSFQSLIWGKIPLFVNTSGRWIAKDMPAFHEEPYMNSMENYISKIEFDVSHIETSSTYRSYASSWSMVSSYLLSNTTFGGAIDDKGYLRDAANEIKKSTSSPEMQLKMAAQKIKHLKWDKTNSLYANWSNLEIMYNKGEGNSAELNLALLQLVKLLGFDAVPVVLSTRDNGTLSVVQPSLNKLNYVVVCTWLDHKAILMDATEPLLPFNLLPIRCLNHLGRSICDTTSWVVLSPKVKDKQGAYYDLTLQDDMNISGKLNITKFDYAGFYFRKKFQEFNSKEEFMTDFLSDKPNLTIVSSRFDDMNDVYKPAKEEFEIKIDNQQNVINNEIYIQPLFLNNLDENPFKAESRKYPMDFPCNTERSVTVNLKLPPNVTVSSVPEAVSMHLPDNSVSFVYQVAVTDNMIQVSYKYQNNKGIVQPDEYGNLKEFYNQLIKKQSESIILKKN
jgi:hypothetical protein